MSRALRTLLSALLGASVVVGAVIVAPATATAPAPAPTVLVRSGTGSTGSTTSAPGAVLVAGIPLLCDWNGDGRSTIGVYRPSDSTWHIRNSAGTGPVERSFRYGTPGQGLVPLCGDWNKDRIESPGLYRASDARWMLRNSVSAGAADVQLLFGLTGGRDRPLVGDWNGDGVDTVAVYRPSTRRWFLQDHLRAGSTITMLSTGAPAAADALIVGDWDGDRRDTPGWVTPARQWQLRASSTATSTHRAFSWGARTDVPLVGDVDGDRRDEPVLRRPAAAAPAPIPSPPSTASTLYVDPTSQAALAATRLRAAGRTADAATIDVIAAQPQAFWIGDWQSTDQVAAQLRSLVAASGAASQTLVVATYAIPMRDCGGYSSGGLSDAAYRTWTAAVAEALRGSGAIVIVEPDALALLTSPACASVATSRPALLAETVRTLSSAGLRVYLDAGHSNWVSPERMAELLRASGVESARGFATNVSNTNATASEQAYAERVSALIGGKSYVIDVSRNGRGSTGEWCNPSGAAIGAAPRLVAEGRLDGLLWIKRPGESDGPCNGAPAAGQWWDAGALALVRNR